MKKLSNRLEENKKLETIQNLFKKMETNSIFPTSITVNTYLYDKELCDNITLDGRKYINKLVDETNNL